MSDIHTVGMDLFSFSDNGMRKPVSRITLYVNNEDDQVYTAGDDTGLELSATCIYATQEMANTLLSMAKGAQYQMYEAQAANLDPAAELGDGIEVGGITSVIAQINDNGDGYPDVSASGEQEVEDEYPGASRQGPIQRELARARSLISKTNDRISFEIYGEDGKGGLNGRMNTFTLGLSGISGQIKGYQETLDGYSKQLVEYELGLKGFEANLEQYTSEVNGYKEETARYAAAVDGFSADVERYTSEVNGYKEETARYAATVDGFSAEMERYNSAVEGYDSAVTEYTKEVGSYKLAVDGYSAQVFKYSETVDGYTEQVNSYKGTVEGYEQTVAQYSKDVEGYKSEYSTISQTFKGIKLEATNNEGTVSIQLKSGDTALGTPGTIDLTGLVTFTALETGPDEEAGQTVINGGWIGTSTLQGKKIKGATYYDDEEIGRLRLAVKGADDTNYPWLVFDAENDDGTVKELFSIVPIRVDYGWVAMTMLDTTVLTVSNGVVHPSAAWNMSSVNMVANSKNYGTGEPPEDAVEGQVYFKLVS